MFGKKVQKPEVVPLTGLITFFGSYHALRSESVLAKAGFSVRLVPGPREISPNCGVALRFQYELNAEVVSLLSEKKVQYEAVHSYGDPTS